MKKRIIHINSLQALTRLERHGWQTLSGSIGQHIGIWHMARGLATMLVICRG